MKWIRYGLPILMILYPVVWFVVILNMTDDVSFFVPFSVVILGIIINSDIDMQSAKNQKISTFLNGTLISMIMIGLLTNEIVTNITFNQFALIFAGVYFTLEFMLHRIEPFRQAVISM
ncbi:hypothetical protein FO441_03815 [Salinicoccus cyprini]|uniref:Uncharacterized protein n=1 Tax=Salinicoccus cyprini TaxID=2493691 RepID=A0A558AYT7_9STAP|nr:hypothetical protein [Salinicoccus cyprini]TVT29420.1 hypothetical protein FO441_03815 [Salinicoccus cyprini]